MKRRRIIVEVATSADGYIARPDGDVTWLDRPRVKGNYGLEAFFKTIDTILWGRKTYEKGIAMGMKSSFSPSVKNYLFSRSPQTALIPGFESAVDPVKRFAKKLRRQPGKHIWMMGGGELIASFLDEGEIDEFRIKLIPVMIGEGIPLIQPRHRLIRLKLLSTKKYPDGVVGLHYQVHQNRNEN